MSRWDCCKGGRVSMSEFYSFTGRHVTGVGYRGRKATWYTRKGTIWGKPDLAVVAGAVYDFQQFGSQADGIVKDTNFLVYLPEFNLEEDIIKEMENPLENNGISLLERYQLLVDIKGDSIYHDIGEDWRGAQCNILKVYPFMVDKVQVITWDAKEFYPLGSFSHL